MSDDLIFGKTYPSEIIEYFKKENLSQYFRIDDKTKKFTTSLDVFKSAKPFVPEMDDLVRLHKLIRERKVFTVLEFGIGFSTIVMADAIAKNKKDFEKLNEKPDIRNLNKFKLFSLDTSSKWIANTKKIFPEELSDFVEFKKSGVHIDTFNGRICHFYDNLPDVVPDFIYVDGPYKLDIKGLINGLNFNSIDVTPIAADLLFMEPILLPGTFVILDGRTNNARFLKNNFQRNWEYTFDVNGDVSMFELIEEPLGSYNKNQLKFCLGKSYFKKLLNH